MFTVKWLYIQVGPTYRPHRPHFRLARVTIYNFYIDHHMRFQRKTWVLCIFSSYRNMLILPILMSKNQFLDLRRTFSSTSDRKKNWSTQCEQHFSYWVSILFEHICKFSIPFFNFYYLNLHFYRWKNIKILKWLF